jgi:hypothetical protein
MRALAICVVVVFLALLLPAFQAAPPGADGGGDEGGLGLPIAVFEVGGGGALFHLEGGVTQGQKAFKTKLSSQSIGQCIAGGLGCAGEFDPDEINADGKAYIYVYDATTWGITTSADPANTVPAEGTNPVPVTMLTGLMDGKGRFMFAGNHGPSESFFIMEGKAALQKNSLLPTKISGRVQAVSTLAEHWSKGKFKTLGKALVF